MYYKLYKLHDGSTAPHVLVLNDGMEQIACIPADPANTDWQQYQAWLAEGNTPLEADE